MKIIEFRTIATFCIIYFRRYIIIVFWISDTN